MRSWLSVVFVVAACGNDHGLPDPGDDMPPPEPDVCESSYLDYGNFGAQFSANWCRGCHSSEVPQAMRQHAPVGVDFDDEADLLEWKVKIRAKATGDKPTMPPAGGPSVEERALLAEWIDCGMK